MRSLTGAPLLWVVYGVSNVCVRQLAVGGTVRL